MTSSSTDDALVSDGEPTTQSHCHPPDRRTILRHAAAALAGAVGGSPIAGIGPAPARTEAPLTELGAVEAVAAMRRGEIAAEAYAHALLRRAQETTRLNAFRILDGEAVLEAARAADKARSSGKPAGLLHGLPIPVKDSVNTAALPTSNGTRALADFRPRANAAVLDRLFGAGALLMGKTNLHELSFGWTSDNGSFGAVRNPYDLGRSPGGSSGGSAAAVAARVAPLAVAEDTWASIRLPAALCGLVGLRPTFGRYPDDGIMPLTAIFDQVGPLARRVADLVLFDTVAAQDVTPVTAVPLGGIRLGLPDVFWEGLSGDVDAVARAGLARLRESGTILIERRAPDPMPRASEIATTIIGFEARDSIARFLALHGAPAGFEGMFAKVAPNVKAAFEGLALPPYRPSTEAHTTALADIEQLKGVVARQFREQQLDAFVFPVALVTAPPIGAETVTVSGQALPLSVGLARNTALGSCVGMASLVIPAGLTPAGLPVGLEFAALPGQDRKLLRLGLSLETALETIPAPTLR